MKKILIPLTIITLAFGVSASALTAPRATTTRATTTQSIKKVDKNIRPSVLNSKQIARADASCAKASITKRDEAIKNALQKYTNDWIAVMDKKTTAQKAAYDKEGNERLTANREASRVAKTEQTKIQRELSRERMRAQDLFRVETKACGFETDSLEE